MRIRFLLAAATIALAAPVAAQRVDPPGVQVEEESAATRDFRALLDEHYRWLLRNSPTFATALGVRDFDNEIQDLSPAARERRVAEARAFLARVDAIPADQLSQPDRVTRAILRRTLAESVEEWRFGQRDMLFTT